MPELKEEVAEPSAADSDDAEYDGDESSEDEKDEELVRRNCAELCTGITIYTPHPTTPNIVFIFHFSQGISWPFFDRNRLLLALKF